MSSGMSVIRVNTLSKADSDSVLLASRMDAVLFVICYNRTNFAELARVRALLSRTEVRVLGAIVNDFPSGGGQHEQYQGYGAPYYA